MENRCIHENEKTYYTLCLVLSILAYLSLIISLIGILYIIIGFVITLILHGVAVGNIRNNGVKLSERQFPDIYSRAKKVAQDMGVQNLPDIFIIQSGGVLNAFATSFLGKNFIVLYSDIVEMVKSGHEEELNFIIAHELAHIKRRHITKHFLILPALWVPFLGNAYSRACEFTCDRMAASYIHEPLAATNALAVLAVGKTLISDMDIEEYIQTAKKEEGFFIWFSQVLSTHPPLPKRMEDNRNFTKRIEAFNIIKAG